MKRFARGAASAGFKLCILLLAVTAAFSLTFGKPGIIKTSLKDSGIYDHVVESVLSQVKQDEQAGEGEPTDIPLDSAGIQNAAQTAFPPQLLQQSTEQIVDGVYHWLDGQSQTPDFTIDLSSVKQNLANAIGDQAFQRVQSLPVCTQQQLRELDPNNLDPFSIPCVPPGLNLQAERQKIVDEVASSSDFLKDPVITANDWKDQSGQNPFEKVNQAPKTFQLVKNLPWIFGALSLLLGAAVVFLHENTRRGLFVLSRTLLVTGLVLLVGALITVYILRNFKPDGDLANSAALQNSLASLVRTLTDAFNRILLFFAIAYSATGGGGLLALHFTKPKGGEHLSATDEKTPEPTPKPDVPKTSKS